jgi:hypothetical protein
MRLPWVMAYHSFGGEVEASNTPTIRRLTPSHRHQLPRITRRDKAASPSYILLYPPIISILKATSHPLMPLFIGRFSAEVASPALPRRCDRKRRESCLREHNPGFHCFDRMVPPTSSCTNHGHYPLGGRIPPCAVQS